MAREGSVAPKERINVVYKSKIKGKENIELPFKMLVLADLTGQPKEDAVEQRKPINIDKDCFADVLESQDLKVELSVPNRLVDDDEMDTQLDVSLRFSKLNDFTPEGVAHQVPELQKLLELRDALSALKSPLGNRPEFRKRIQSILSDDKAREQLLAELGMMAGKTKGEE